MKTPRNWAKSLKQHRGKSLDEAALVELWREMHGNNAIGESPSQFDPIDRENQLRRQAPTTRPDSLSDWVRVNRALRGMNPDGIAKDALSEGDIGELSQPRCGCWRVSPQSIPSPMEDPLGRREWFSQPEVGWSKSKMKLFIRPNSIPPSSISDDYYRSSVLQAMASWNLQEIGITIEETPSIQAADVVIEWSTPNTDAHRMLTELVLAHADYPPPNLQYVSRPPLPLCLNRLAFWASKDADDVEIRARYDLESFVLHELGHCLGLFHRAQGSIMYEIITKGRHRVLDPDTIQAAKFLYPGQHPVFA
ncbi:MAG: matrixin family metalloprotease [Planctomycetota bacterium]